jgi:hypothetical protein
MAAAATVRAVETVMAMVTATVTATITAAMPKPTKGTSTRPGCALRLETTLLPQPSVAMAVTVRKKWE